MNEEAVVVNLFLVVRVFLVGGIFYAYPRISRKGLVFGIYVGEEEAEGEAARDLLRSWSRGVLKVMALSLLVGLGISVAGWPVPGNLTGTAVLLLSAPLLYLRTYCKAKTLAPPAAARQAQVGAAPLSVDDRRGDGLAKLALIVCLLTSLGTAAHTMLSFEALPDRVPTLISQLGGKEALTDKSLIAALFIPSLNLVLSTFFALFALLIARAKRSVRGGSGGRSLAAQNAFRVTFSQTFAGMGLFTCLLLAMLSVHTTRIALSQTPSLGWALLWACCAMIVFALSCLVRVFRITGQGGALLEEGSVEAPLTGGLADNAHWILGVIYVNRSDPSVMVENRFGIGYTLNYGNWSAVLFMGAFTVLMLGLIALTLTGVVS